MCSKNASCDSEMLVDSYIVLEFYVRQRNDGYIETQKIELPTSCTKHHGITNGPVMLGPKVCGFNFAMSQMPS
jgi:hypothetical protein